MKSNTKVYSGNLKKFNPKLKNESEEICPNISFLEIEITGKVKKYKDYLENYFKDLGINKNNFFTDISNYLAYETDSQHIALMQQKWMVLSNLKKERK